MAGVPWRGSTRCIVSQNGDLPFPDETFDLAFSYVVLEHVGTVPPYEVTTEDTQSQRYAYMRNAVAKLRSGGVLIIMTLNKWVPIDPHHGHYYIPWSNWFLEKSRFHHHESFLTEKLPAQPKELDQFPIGYRRNSILIAQNNGPKVVFFWDRLSKLGGSCLQASFRIAPRSWRRYLIAHIIRDSKELRLFTGREAQFQEEWDPR